MAVRRRTPLLVLGVLVAALVVPGGALRAVAAPGPAVGEGTVVGFGESVPVASTAPRLDDLVSVASTPTGLGWWAVAGDGRTIGAGDATPLGAPTPAPRAPVVAITAAPQRGAWLASSDGGVFALGGAAFHGSAGALPLRSPIVGMAATPTGRGYWLVAGDGGVFTYGDARFHGAGVDGTTAMAPTGRGGYWLLTVDGAVRGFGAGATPTSGDLVGRLPDAAAVSITPVGGVGGRGYRIGVGRVRDVLTVWQPGGLGAAAEAWARDVAARAGGRVSLRHRSNVDLPAPNGWRIPLTLTAVEPAVAVALVGPTGTAALQRGEAVLGRAAASLRSASVGSTIQLLARDGGTHTRRVGAIVPDGRIAWSEVALATSDAARLGIVRPFAVDVWGATRRAIDAALASAPPMPTKLGVERSWHPPSPDGTLAAAQLKARVGEVAYRPGTGDGVALDPAWVRANIVTESVPALGRVTCHRAVMPALRGALAEVAQRGLSGALGRYGGCYNPRLIRGGDSGGILSRHSYGVAIDVNTTRNVFGGRVELDGRVVEIFRRWGFAWGGTWVRPDGMHLEWAP